MSRNLKRVPMDFSWPLHKVWGGYVNPYYNQCTECPDCENGYDRAGGRPDANAALFSAQWYGNAPFDPVAYGAESLSQCASQIWGRARRNVRSAPDYYMTDKEQAAIAAFKQEIMEGLQHDVPIVPFPVPDAEAAITREAQRLYLLWKDQWCHHLIQADVDALIAAERLWDFTRVPRDAEQAFVVAVRMAFHNENSWLPESNGYRPTATEVNAWSFGGFGHDGLNQSVCVEARCKREGVPYTCARCSGSGRIWPTPEIKKQCDEWEQQGPPAGDGYQLWEDCSEGSPVSPVFASLEELCCWCANHATTFGPYKATKEKWREMLDDGIVHAKVGGNVFL